MSPTNRSFLNLRRTRLNIVVLVVASSLPLLLPLLLLLLSMPLDCNASLFSSSSSSSSSSPNSLHRRQTELSKLSDRSRQTGMHRSKWFGYREYYKDTSLALLPNKGKDKDKGNNSTSSAIVTTISTKEEFGVKDRVCFKFNPNGSVKFYTKRIRPLLQIGEKYWCGLGYGADLQDSVVQRARAEANKNPHKLKRSRRQKSAKETLEERELKKLLIREDLYNVDGTYFTEVDIDGSHRVKIDMREFDKRGQEQKSRFEVSWDWGRTDPLAQRFTLGRIYVYPNENDEKKRVGVYIGGVVSITANPHRPVVSKDLQSFQ